MIVLSHKRHISRNTLPGFVLTMSSFTVAMSTTGEGDHNIRLLAISRVYKHLRSVSSQPGCYTFVYFHYLMDSASFPFDFSVDTINILFSNCLFLITRLRNYNRLLLTSTVCSIADFYIGFLFCDILSMITLAYSWANEELCSSRSEAALYDVRCMRNFGESLQRVSRVNNLQVGPVSSPSMHCRKCFCRTAASRLRPETKATRMNIVAFLRTHAGQNRKPSTRLICKRKQ